MNEAAVRKKLNELHQTLTEHPVTHKRSAGGGIYQPETTSEEPTIGELMERLRMGVKYLVFDLEATRRENRYLREMLENRHTDNNGNNDDFNGMM